MTIHTGLSEDLGVQPKKQGFFRAGIITTCQVNMTDMADSDGTKMTNVVGCAHAQ
jgi:hypothetical protein